MTSSTNRNDLLINLKPKIIRFTGEKFPSELWNKCPLNRKLKNGNPEKYN